MERLTKTYSDGTHGASDSLPCGRNSYDYKRLLIEKLGKYEDLEEQNRLIFEPISYNAIECKDAIRAMAKEHYVKTGANNKKTARSMIHPQYADRFIRQYILDEEIWRGKQ